MDIKLNRFSGRTWVYNKEDLFGAFASFLCFIHCLFTPFIFVAQSGLHEVEGPGWWKYLDILFLVLSLLAIYWAAKNTSKRWVSFAFYFLWLLLAFIVINEKMEFRELPEALIYVPTTLLIALHLYNRKYCRCADDDCCVEP
jgi:hypothetical protein